jgi:hypothetical protein
MLEAKTMTLAKRRKKKKTKEGKKKKAKERKGLHANTRTTTLGQFSHLSSQDSSLIKFPKGQL